MYTGDMSVILSCRTSLGPVVVKHFLLSSFPGAETLNLQLSHEVIKADPSQASEIQPAGMFHLTIQSIPTENERGCFGGGLGFTGPSNVIAVNKTFRLIKKLDGWQGWPKQLL